MQTYLTVAAVNFIMPSRSRLPGKKSETALPCIELANLTNFVSIYLPMHPITRALNQL